MGFLDFSSSQGALATPSMAGLTIACSTVLHRSAETRRAAATHRLCSRRSQARDLGMPAGQLQACMQIKTQGHFEWVWDKELNNKL